MLFMVIERFKNRDAKAVYRRFRDQGRMASDGLTGHYFFGCAWNPGSLVGGTMFFSRM